MLKRPRTVISDFSFAVIATVIGLAPQLAKADFFLHGWENQYESKSFWSFQFTGMYFQSNTNFSTSGSVSSSDTLRNYGRIQSDLILRFGFADRFSAFTRLGWAYINQDSSLRRGIGFGLSDQSVGLNWRVYGPALAIPSAKTTPSLDFQIQLDFPGYSQAVSSANQTPDLGDGTLDFTGGLFATLPVSTSKTTILTAVPGIGYTYRNLGYSSAIPWSLAIQYYPYEEGFFANFTTLGVFSAKTDLNNGSRFPLRSNEGSGGSFITGDVNPSLMQVRGEMGMKIGLQTQLSISVMQSIWGQAAPNGLTVMAGFMTRIGRDKSMNPILMSPHTYGESNQGFVNYSLEGKVIRFNERLNLVKIDKGSQDGVEAGQIFDIFLMVKDGASTEAVARAKVSSVKMTEAALDVIEYYKEVWIEEGFSVKRLIQ